MFIELDFEIPALLLHIILSINGILHEPVNARIIVKRLIERRIIYSLSAGGFSGLSGFGLQLVHTKRISFSPSTHLFTSISLAMPMAKVAITKRETNTIDAAFMVNASFT